MEFVDVTFIGGGPVGLFGVFYSGMRGLTTRIIDSLPHLGGQLTALYPEKNVYDMPGFPKILAKDLAASLIEQGLQFEPEVVLEETATKLEKVAEGFVIHGAKGKQYPTRTIIICAGAGALSPTKLGIEGEDEFIGNGLHYGIKSKADFAGKTVAIVGGGDSAFDWALELHGIAKKIIMIHRRDQFRAHDDSVRKAKQLDFDWQLWKVVNYLHGEPEINSVTLTDTQTKESSTIKCDAVIVNIGFKSSLGPIKDWGLEIEKNQIAVDDSFQTNIPGVFAVGDVCTFKNKIKLIATGVGEAATAVCMAKLMIDPSAKLFPGHSSDMAQFSS